MIYPFAGPFRTPAVMRVLIVLTAALSLLYPLLTYISLHFFKSIAPGFWLPLSWIGIKAGFYWQLLTFLFVHSVGTDFSLSLLTSLSLHLFLIWFCGCEVAQQLGNLRFLLFYFLSALIAGSAALLYFHLFDRQGFLVGSGPPLYALIALWGMRHRHLTFHIFFKQIAAKWALIALLGIPFLLNMLWSDYVYCLVEIVAIGWGVGASRLVRR